MEGTRRPLYKFLTFCWLLPGAFLQAPEEGQNSSSAVPSFSSWTVTPSVINMTNDSTDVSSLNISSTSSSESLASTARGFLDATKIQDVDQITSRGVDVSSVPASTENSVKSTQATLDYANHTSTTSWITSDRNMTAMEPSQSKEMQGPTATPQPESSTFVTLGLMERKLDSTPVTVHEAITKQSGAKSTSAPVMTGTDGTVLTVSSSISAALTLVSHTSSLIKTEQPVTHMQKKTTGTDPPSILETNSVGEDPLVIAVIFVFIVTVGILALICFLRYRQRSGQLQFRRLQDLPMDDMMEDTPLSLYSF
uniref:Uncharacterized protein n=1 Tax=Salvator merianae TaxID=96440 RepID=A0A8D0DYQ5_SALMN